MLDQEGQSELLDRIMAIFTNEAEANSFGEDPSAYIDEKLPEGTEAADVASCMPEVADRMGGDYGSHLANYNAAGAAATQSVATEIAYTYNTTYQQNTFIYAEEGSQVTNIQGDGNAVSQQQIDADFGVDDDYGAGEPEPEEGYEKPEEQPEEGDGYEEPGYENGEEQDGYEEQPQADTMPEGDYQEPEYQEPEPEPDYEEPKYETEAEPTTYEPPADDGMPE